MELYKNDTIAAISTAMTGSGIGIIRISGEKSVSIAEKIFHPGKKGKKLSEQAAYTAHYGMIKDGEEIIDEVLVLLMKKPHSYTAEDTVEIHCHGGVYVMKRILDLVIRNGARPADPGEFTKRAFLNGRIDLSQAEAVMDVIQAKNEYALKNSVSQLKGSVMKKIRALREQVLYEIAYIESALDDPENPKSVTEECKEAINECHKRGISVMLDLPSCASLDFSKRHPELMAKEKDGQDKTPQGWQDIRMFRVWDNEGTRQLNPKLLDMHKKYVEACVELGIDGIRADVSRAKPIEFWNVIIPYSQTLDPQFGWLAESYTHEDASPQLNMPYDRPEDQLRGGFNSYYGQFHILNQWTKADDLFNYMKENIDMSNRMKEPKSLIGSMTTHDDQSPMYYGGAPWVMFTTALQNTLPMVNPYYIDGVQTGDYYLYPYDHAKAPNSQTDNNECTVHTGRLDIFNFSRKPGGDFPQIQEFIKAAHNIRSGNIKPEYKDIIEHGSFIKLETNNPEVIAYARHKDGKTLLFVGNRNANLRRSAKIQIPGFKSSQELNNLVPTYSKPSYFQKSENELTVDLGPLRAHVFEINTPDIEYYSKPTSVMQQNF